jgi:hypothetical protein
MADAQPFERPSAGERWFNKAFGVLVRLGLGLPHNYLVEVRGRKTGRLHSTPVDVLVLDGRRFLVAGRGYTQWVGNAMASGSVVLRKGRRTVRRYFPLPAGSSPEAFRPLVDRYPAFELVPKR